MLKVGLVLVVVGMFAAVGLSDADDPGLPNLRPLEPVRVYALVDSDGKRLMGIAPRVENMGSAPLEIRGIPSGSDVIRIPAEQCAIWNGVVCSSWQPAGTVTQRVSPLYSCWEHDAAMAYELRYVDGTGDPAEGDSGIVARAVAARQWFDDRPDHDHPSIHATSIPSYGACIASVRQGLSAGWLSVWDDDLPDQQLLIEDVVDGTYALLVIVDPLDHIEEADEEDNILMLHVRISGDGARVELIP